MSDKKQGTNYNGGGWFIPPEIMDALASQKYYMVDVEHSVLENREFLHPKHGKVRVVMLLGQSDMAIVEPI